MIFSGSIRDIFGRGDPFRGSVSWFLSQFFVSKLQEEVSIVPLCLLVIGEGNRVCIVRFFS